MRFSSKPSGQHRTAFLTIILTILLSGGIAAPAGAQSPMNRLDSLGKQYWFLRERMVNDFMLGIGPEQGQSLLSYRRYYDKALKFGDNTIKLGHYISLLATEYALLSRNGESLGQTTRELFYALYAVNRLDLQGEIYFRDASGNPGTPTLNGFLVRDDVGALDPAMIPRLNTEPSLIRVDKIRSDYLDTLRGPFINTPSQDQVIYLLAGLSLVVKLLPDAAAFREGSTIFAFQDGEVAFVAEARRIIERLVSFMYTPPWTWDLVNPVTGVKIPQRYGGSALALSWGFHGVMRQWAGKTLRGTGDQEKMYERLFQTFSSPTVFRRVQRGGEGDKILMLAAMSNAWGDETLDLILQLSKDRKGIYQFDQIPMLSRILFPELSSANWNPAQEKQYYFNLLMKLPCGMGPYHHGPYSNPAYFEVEWSANDRIVEPEQRGHKGRAHWYGDFSGYDWMIYHNFYRLVFDDYQGFIQPNYLSMRHVGQQEFKQIAVRGSAIQTRPLVVESMLIFEGSPGDTLWVENGCSWQHAGIICEDGSTLAFKGLTVIFTSGTYLDAKPGSNVILMDGTRVHFQNGTLKQIAPGAVFLNTGNSSLILPDEN